MGGFVVDKKLLRAAQGFLLENIVRPSGKNNSLRVHFPDLFQTQSVRVHLTVNTAFPDSAGNQLIVLSAEIHYDDHFLFHGCSSCK